jgi:hypothetical protein
MFDETDPSFFDSTDPTHFGEPSGLPVEMVLVLGVALLLLIDLVFVAQRGKLRLHLALETGAAVLTLLAAARAWFRRARLVARTRKPEPVPASPGDINAPIDARLWGAIEAALIEEAMAPTLRLAPRRLPPIPPARPAPRA